MAPGTGMFRSRDGGRSFSPLPDGGRPGPRHLRHGVFSADAAFHGADAEAHTVWSYRDGRWSDLAAAGSVPRARYTAITADLGTGAIVAADEGGQAVRSTDGGRSWRRLAKSAGAGSGDPPWLRVSNQSYFATADLRADPAVPGRLWVGAGTGVYFADAPLAGMLLRWTSRTRGIEQLVTTDAVQPPGAAPSFAAWDFGIHVKPDLDRYSTTYGPAERVVIAAQQVAWTPADPAFLATNASDTRMNCCSEDGRSVLAGYSRDGGRSWTRFPTLPHPPGTRPDDPWRMAFGMIAVAAGDTANIVWAPSFNRSPFYTKDRGATWARVVLPGERLPFTGSHANYYLSRRTLAADRVLPATFYLVHSGEGDNAALTGLWTTDDGGARWRRVFHGEIAPLSRHAAKLRAVPGRAGHLFFSSSLADGAPDTRLRRSVDGGRSWRAIEEVTQVDDIGFGKAAAGAGYPTIFISGRVGGTYGVWRSTDEGARWQRLAGFPARTLDQVSVVEGDKDVFGRVYLGYKGSGWIYGQPAACDPAKATVDCVTVERAVAPTAPR